MHDLRSYGPHTKYKMLIFSEIRFQLRISTKKVLEKNTFQILPSQCTTGTKLLKYPLASQRPAAKVCGSQNRRSAHAVAVPCWAPQPRACWTPDLHTWTVLVVVLQDCALLSGRTDDSYHRMTWPDLVMLKVYPCQIRHKEFPRLTLLNPLWPSPRPPDKDIQSSTVPNLLDKHKWCNVFWWHRRIPSQHFSED